MDHKPHLVNWATMCLDKKNGGLGVRGLFKLNKALLSKWNWRLASMGRCRGGWCLGEKIGNFGTGVWKEIRNDWVTLVDNSRFLMEMVVESDF